MRSVGIERDLRGGAGRTGRGVQAHQAWYGVAGVASAWEGTDEAIAEGAERSGDRGEDLEIVVELTPFVVGRRTRD